MSITVHQFTDKLIGLVEGGRLKAILRKELIATGIEAQGNVQAKIEERLKVRTGALRRSPASRIEILDRWPQLTVSAGGARGGRGELRYAALQEFGGTVRPVKGRFLAIPVGPALTAAGVPRYASPRDVPGLAYVQSRKGQPLLVMAQNAGKVGKSGRAGGSAKGGTLAGSVWYILRRSVTIRGKFFVRDGVADAFTGFGGRISSAIAQAMQPVLAAPAGA